MNKKLPEIFHNTISKKIYNNENIFYSKNEDANNDLIRKNDNNKKNIRKLINDIFSSSDYIYKANVLITTKDGVIENKIIGKNQKFLITMDNKTILIDDIIDIKKK